MVRVSKEHALTQFGLSPREAKVYLAALLTGTATANSIARQAKVERTTTYDVLKSLTDKGIAARTTRNGKNCFEVIQPKKLISILEERKRFLSDVLPELELLSKVNLEKPKVKLFEGKEGIKSMFYDIYDLGLDFDVYANSALISFLRFDFDKFVQLRTKKEIFVRVIHEKSKETFELIKKDKKELRDTRFIDDFHLPAATLIYGNKVAIVTFSQIEPVGIVIDNKDTADAQRVVFEKLWSIAKKK
ncbi:MAG TPA: helix-turn-helix domain-containing protein [Candidatus Nanoarchaeia archaeon]|nr:helix-turn-helix domain-containing protein [Candidatus Nanoarchaeia archaeon]